MDEQEIASLGTLPDRVKQVLASPTCLSSPRLTILDAMQIALDAIRLDAVYEGPEGDVKVSSALMRESDLVDGDPQWPPILEGRDDAANWRVDHFPGGPPPNDYIRAKLCSKRDRITLKWRPDSGGKPLTSGDCHAFKELVIWTRCRSDDHSNKSPSRRAVEAIRNALDVCASMSPLRRGPENEDPSQKELSIFHEKISPEFLSRVFLKFDDRLRWLLQNHAELTELTAKELLDPFLAQFFWVKDVGDASTHELPLVVPVFLPEQNEGLLNAARALSKPALNPETFTVCDIPVSVALPATAGEDAASWAVETISHFQMNSNSLFSAFPTDTLMSVYIENWPSEKIQDGALLLNDEHRNTRALFKKLTTTAIKSRNDPSTEGDQTDLTLFSVPVLVGSTPLFVVQINSPRHLPVKVRAVLSDAIRALGGVVDFEIQFRSLMEFDATQSQLLKRAALYSLTEDQDLNSFCATLPALGGPSPEDGSKTAESNPGAQASTAPAFKELERIRHLATLQEKRLDEMCKKSDTQLGGRSPFLIIEAINNALERIPRMRKQGLQITKGPPPATDFLVEGVPKAFEYAVQSVVVGFAESEKPAELSISFAHDYADGKPHLQQVVITFREINTVPNRRNNPRTRKVEPLLHVENEIRNIMRGRMVSDVTPQGGAFVVMTLPISGRKGGNHKP